MRPRITQAKEGDMNCPICGHSLMPLLAALAGTSGGAQCPRCWMRVRFLSKGPAHPRRGSGHWTKRPEKLIKPYLVN
jgi:hypothetical protein